jgi:hypothetical protein
LAHHVLLHWERLELLGASRVDWVVHGCP